MTSLVLQATGGDGVSCRFTPHSIEDILRREEKETKMGVDHFPLRGRGHAESLGRLGDNIVLVGRGEDQHVLGRREDQLLGRGEKRGREEQAVSPSFEKVKTIRLGFLKFKILV